MINKKIHIIWIGDESKRPDGCIETWVKMNPGYSVRVWGNNDLRDVVWHTGSLMKKWVPVEINGCADVMRWEILYSHGGVAVDADSICVRPLEDWLLEPDVFAVWENEVIRPGLVACGALGAKAGHPFIGQIINDMMSDGDPLSSKAWDKVGPGRITRTMLGSRYRDLTIYPSHYFIPDHYTGVRYGGSGPIFARQAWGSTRENYGNLKF